MNNDYAVLKAQYAGLIENESNFLANAANLCALLFQELADLNWVGFYLLRGKDLVLGPFQGRPACTRIAMSTGVCGTAAVRRQTVIVDDVHQFPGHIACDAASNAEIVVPLLFGDRLLGVLDLDSPSFERFSTADQAGLEQLLDLLLTRSGDTLGDLS